MKCSSFLKLVVAAIASGVSGLSLAAGHSASEYQREGLLAQWDGIENVALGEATDTSSTIWADISGNDYDKIRAFVAEEIAAMVIKCPHCGSEMVLTGKGLWCPDCKFNVWRTVAQKQLSDDSLRQLVRNGRTRLLTGFISKKGEPFEAALALDRESGSVSFIFNDKKQNK